MTSQYSEDVQNILNIWLADIQKLAEKGKISPLLAENVQNLIASGKVADVKKIRIAIENGVKNVGAN
jgi:hypothetical protein